MDTLALTNSALATQVHRIADALSVVWIALGGMA
jgi:hypothetical protein